jgi:hypothetical protein
MLSENLDFRMVKIICKVLGLKINIKGGEGVSQWSVISEKPHSADYFDCAPREGYFLQWAEEKGCGFAAFKNEICAPGTN